MWTRFGARLFAPSVNGRRTANTLLSGAVAAAGVGAIAASEPRTSAGAAYKYEPPVRAASTRTAAALEAARPLRSVPSKPLPRVLFVLGGPGAGKGTQCAKLVSEYGFVHLSAGDLLREERSSGSADAEMIESYIREGQIVPVEVTVKLLGKAMERSGVSKFLVDGFPRNFNNLEGWKTVMAGKAVVDGVVLYDVEEETMVARLLERGKTSGRSDDNAESIRKRLRTYVDSTVPVLEHYAAQGKVATIYGGAPVETVFAATKAAVEPTVAAEVLSYNALLLDAVSAGDFAAYSALVSPDVTCFEPEAEEGVTLVRGLDVHRAAFEAGAKGRAKAVLAGGEPGWKVSTMASPNVTLLGGRHALVTYTRVVTPLPSATASEGSLPAEGASSRVAETRVWALNEAGAWKNVHFHRGVSQRFAARPAA